MKKVLLAFMALFVLFASTGSSFAAQKTPRVAVWWLTSKSSLHKLAYDGFMQGIKEDGLVAGKDIIVDTFSSNDDENIANEQLPKMLAGNYDVIMSIGTVGTKFLVKNNVTQKPIIFSVVTDPVKSNIIAKWEEPGNNYSGTSNRQSIGKTLDHFLEICPKITRLGVIYTDGQDNSLVQIKELEELKSKFPNIKEIVYSPAKDEADLTRATQILVGKVDGILLPADAMVGSLSVKKITEVATPNKIPVFGSNGPVIEVGAIGALYTNYPNMGVLTWKMVQKVINGASPKNLPVEIQQVPDYAVNLKAAEGLGVTVPESVFVKVTNVVE